jgi:hypothetical protein
MATETPPKSWGKKMYEIWASGLTLIALRALLLMLTLGILHHDWSSAIPALGFWACVILSMTFFGLVKR